METLKLQTYQHLVIRYLNRRQIFTVMWWDIFRPNKRNQLITHIKEGMGVKYAYKKVKEGDK